MSVIGIPLLNLPPEADLAGVERGGGSGRRPAPPMATTTVPPMIAFLREHLDLAPPR